jgi:signal transduction histidine kinase
MKHWIHFSLSQFTVTHFTFTLLTIAIESFYFNIFKSFLFYLFIYYLFIYLFIYYLFIYLFIYLFVCLFIYLLHTNSNLSTGFMNLILFPFVCMEKRDPNKPQRFEDEVSNATAQQSVEIENPVEIRSSPKPAPSTYSIFFVNLWREERRDKREELREERREKREERREKREEIREKR